MLRYVAILSLPALAALAGCLDGSDEDEGVVPDGKADGDATFKLKIKTTSGAISATDSPKLVAGATGSMACEDTRTDEGWRLTCTRGDELLTVTYGHDDKTGAAIYKKSASSPDTRRYFHCSSTTAPNGRWPATLSCSSKTPKTNIGGQLVSPFSSSLDGIGIFNSHQVGEGSVYRGMKPFRDADYADLKTLGIDAVLIFKKPTSSHEIQDEIAALAGIDVPADAVINEQFLWKDFPDFAEPCKQTVRSLKALTAWTAAGKTPFFHCTVGEDRTGYLAGLYRLLTETATAHDIFDSELCERGYSAGNPVKPTAAVAKEVDADLTPLYLKMAFKISQGELSTTSLDEAVCDTDPAGDAAFKGADWDPAAYTCSPSTRFRL